MKVEDESFSYVCTCIYHFNNLIIKSDLLHNIKYEIWIN